MEIEGRIKVIMNENVISEKFKKREFVVTTREEYPQDIIMEMINDKCEVLNAFNVGDEVKASINVRGREWINPQGEARYFITLQAWRIESIKQIDDPSNSSGHPSGMNGEIAQAQFDEGQDDDLPF